MYPLPISNWKGPRTTAERSSGAFRCRYCPVDMSSYSTWFFHMLSHVGLYQFTCLECPYRAATKECMGGHAAGHNLAEDYAPYACTTCSFRSEQKNWLTLHTLNSHVVSLFECIICRVKLHSRRELFEHLEGYHLAMPSVSNSVVKQALNLHRQALQASGISLDITDTTVGVGGGSGSGSASGSASASASGSASASASGSASASASGSASASASGSASGSASAAGASASGRCKKRARDDNTGGSEDCGDNDDGSAAVAVDVVDVAVVSDTAQHHAYFVAEAHALEVHEPYQEFLATEYKCKPLFRVYNATAPVEPAAAALDLYYRLERRVPEIRQYRWDLQHRMDVARQAGDWDTSGLLQMQMKAFMYAISSDFRLAALGNTPFRELYEVAGLAGRYKYFAPVSVVLGATPDGDPLRADILEVVRAARERCERTYEAAASKRARGAVIV